MKLPVRSAELVRKKISKRHLAAKRRFAKKHPVAHKFFQENAFDLGRVRERSTKLLTAGVLAGALLLSPPSQTPLPDSATSSDWANVLAQAETIFPEQAREFLAEELTRVLPQKVRPLNFEEEKNVGLLVEKLTGIRARATLEGEHLNTTFGFIGAEQHLPRFPGDTVAQHDEIQASGITPGRGAWGWFAQSRGQLTKEEVQMEKYYVAVQTLYLPDWEKRLGYLRDWYKYRKVLVLNPKTSQAVVAVVADAGPAAWTGKHFGGSPEVMYHLGLHTGPRKGAVLVFFVDDPQHKISLGPVDYNRKEETRQKVAFSERTISI